MKFCPYCGGHYADDFDVCPTDQHSLTRPSEPHNETGPNRASDTTCPSCGARGDYTPALELRSSFNWPAFFAGGIIAVIFFNTSRPKKVRCNKCDALFDIRPVRSKVSLVIFWLLILPIFVLAVIFLVVFLLNVFTH